MLRKPKDNKNWVSLEYHECGAWHIPYKAFFKTHTRLGYVLILEFGRLPHVNGLIDITVEKRVPHIKLMQQPSSDDNNYNDTCLQIRTLSSSWLGFWVCRCHRSSRSLIEAWRASHDDILSLWPTDGKSHKRVPWSSDQGRFLWFPGARVTLVGLCR